MRTEYHRHDQEVIEGVLRIRRDTDACQADLRNVQEAPRPVQVSAVGKCQHRTEGWPVTSGKDRLCQGPEQEERDWIAFICTDTNLSEDEILRIYGKRWDIEVFFKTCKSMLNLGSECHSLSYDALTAHVSLVFIRYMLLSLQQRNNCDDRTISELFLLMIDELADITFGHALQLIVDIMLQMIQERFGLSDAQLEVFVTDFIERLPISYQHALKLKVA